MVEFLKQHKLYLTPLSPIHMGCGEDFEPTNYVIENGFLQLFDPSNIQLPDMLRDQLLKIAARSLPDVSTKSGSQACVKYILDLHHWFKRNDSIIARSAYHFVPLSESVDKEYEEAFGKARNEGEAINQFVIERTEYNPLTGQVYIPGSAFKGMIRTTWLEYLASLKQSEIEKLRPGHEREKNYEKTLLDSFDKDPMRLFKSADFSVTHDQVYTSIQYSINKYKKQPDDQSKAPKGLKVRRESIVEGQYRAFVSESVIQQTEGKIKVSQLTMRDLAKKCNGYYKKRFEKECQLMMDRGFLNAEWYQSTKALLHQLDMQLQMGDVMLVRLGKNTGAESKTDDKFASIKIMQAGGQKPKNEKQTKTLWLASTSDNVHSNMLPFGWAIVEIDPKTDSSAIKSWCESNNSSASIALKFRELKESQIAITAAIAEKEEAEKKVVQAQAEAKRREAEKLANMSSSERFVYDILQIVNQPNLQAGNEAGQKALADIITKLEQALVMPISDQRMIGQALPFIKFKNLVSKKKEKDVKPLLAKLRGEA